MIVLCSLLRHFSYVEPIWQKGFFKMKSVVLQNPIETLLANFT